MKPRSVAFFQTATEGSNSVAPFDRPPDEGSMADATAPVFTADDSKMVDQIISASTTWLYVYAVTLFFSFLATMLATYHMRRLGGDVFRSTVRFVTTSFLLCSSLHALAGGVFYSLLIAMVNSWWAIVEDSLKDLNTTEIPPRWRDVTANGSAAFDNAGGVEAIMSGDSKDDGGEAAFITKLTHGTKPLTLGLVMFLVLENIFLVLSAYWVVLLTRELYKLAKTTHDRGDVNERRKIRQYAGGAVIVFVVLVVAAVVLVVCDGSLNQSYRFLSIFEVGMIILAVLYALISLIRLRLGGRKNEHIHGMLRASPLYQRLKLLMIVCAVFTLPYAIVQFILLNVSEDEVDYVPDYIVGILTMLYYLFGAAQALVMGGSQQCCFRMLYPIIPQHVREAPEWQSLRSTRRHISCLDVEVTMPPELPVFVNTDIESSSALWAEAPQHVIDEAQRIHDDLLRSTLPKYHGYEITTAGDAFQLAFHNIPEAVSYCLEVQLRLLQAKWPSELDGLVPSTKTEREFGLKCNAIFKGLRVRMGIHDTNIEEEGSLVSQVHPVTGKTVYIGASEYIGRDVGDVGYGGQILVSKRVAAWLRANEAEVQTAFVLDYYGPHSVCALDMDVELYEVTPKFIETRRKVFKKRRAAELGVDVIGAKQNPGDSSTDSTEESAAEFRIQRTPTEDDRSGAKLWSHA